MTEAVYPCFSPIIRIIDTEIIYKFSAIHMGKPVNLTKQCADLSFCNIFGKRRQVILFTIGFKKALACIHFGYFPNVRFFFKRKENSYFSVVVIIER